MRDPIVELVAALEWDGKPTFPWVVRWSAGGDPVASAWARSWTPSKMVRLLELASHPASESARAMWRAPILFSSTDVDRARCDAIRRLVPTPPSLTELLAMRRGSLGIHSVHAGAA